MKFPNAAKGIKKIFTAEILNLIVILLVGIASILGVVSLASAIAENATAADVSIIGTGLFVIAAAVIAIIAAIINIVGFVQTAKDEEAFKTIIYLTVLSLIVTVVGSFFTGNQLVTSMVQSVSQIVSLVTSVLVIMGISNMAAKLNRQDVVEKCETYFKIILGIGIITIILKLLTTFLSNQFAQGVAIALAVIVIILSIAEYIMYLYLLAKAKKMLNE